MMWISEKRCCCRENNKVSDQIAADDADCDIKGCEAKLLWKWHRSFLLLLTLHLPEDIIRGDGRSQQCHSRTNTGEIEINMRHKGIEEDFAPIRMRHDCRDDVHDKGQAHDDKNLFQRLKVTEDGKVPEKDGNGYCKPHPSYTCHQLQSAANRHKVG